MNPSEDLAECRVCGGAIPGTIADPSEELWGPEQACGECEKEIEEYIKIMEKRWREERRNNPPPPPRKERKAVTSAQQEINLRRLKRSFEHLP